LKYHQTILHDDGKTLHTPDNRRAVNWIVSIPCLYRDQWCRCRNSFFAHWRFVATTAGKLYWAASLYL